MKSIWTSKTFWANVIMGFVVLLQYIVGLNIADPEILAAIIAILNVILRLFTKQGVSIKRQVQE